jgi:hypothetical protein
MNIFADLQGLRVHFFKCVVTPLRTMLSDSSIQLISEKFLDCLGSSSFWMSHPADLMQTGLMLYNIPYNEISLDLLRSSIQAFNPLQTYSGIVRVK